METEKLIAKAERVALLDSGMGVAGILAAAAYACKGETLALARLNRIRGMGAQLASLPGLRNDAHTGRGCSSSTEGAPKLKGERLRKTLACCPPKTYRGAATR